MLPGRWEPLLARGGVCWEWGEHGHTTHDDNDDDDRTQGLLLTYDILMNSKATSD